MPSTTSIRVFLAVATEGSTSRAAVKVNLTQSAVSKQLLGLEATLGVALFERSAQGLKLTEAGAVFMPYAEIAIEQIAKAMDHVAERRNVAQPVRLHMVAIVGERWLMDRFPDFAAAHPGIDVQFTNFVSETATEDPDLTIWHGTAPKDDGESHYLFGRNVSLVASPGFLEKSGSVSSPADVQRLTYLQHFQMPSFWAELTETTGMRGALPARVVRYGYFSVIIKAAVAGLGIALVPTCFIREELAGGRLVRALDLSFESASGCWLTVTRTRTAPCGLDAFANWLKLEAKRFDTMG
jgi:LysR family transcriptional regulator, glycine cleavage system transcriptional activator